MLVFGGDLGEGETRTQRHVGNHASQTPQIPTGTWFQAEGGKGGSTLSREWRQTQKRGAGRRDERWRMAGGGWGAMHRWAELCTRRGGGERVKKEEFYKERL